MIDDCSGDVNQADGMLRDRFIGVFNAFQDYAGELADETLLVDVPDNIRFYFDYEAFARDLAVDHTTIDTKSGVAVFHD